MTKMFFTAMLITTSISFQLTAQVNTFMQRLPLLDDVTLQLIEDRMPPRIVREAATRTQGQFNVLILSGKEEQDKRDAVSYLAQKVMAFVFRIDLSLLVSQNILQTKKNIDLVFEEAKNKNCVLFFDEAESLFGSRGNINSSHNRYDSTGTNYFIRQLDIHRNSVIISTTPGININPLLYDKYVKIHVK